VIYHDKCRAFEIVIEKLQRENALLSQDNKELKKTIGGYEAVALGIYLIVNIVFAIVVAWHTPIGM
jgi:hypothetical protein